jgi:hypothetical protein
MKNDKTKFDFNDFLTERMSNKENNEFIYIPNQFKLENQLKNKLIVQQIKYLLP